MKAGLLVAVLVLAACGGGAAEAPPRESARDLAGTTLAGERLSLAEVGGKPVFVIAFSAF